VAKTLTDAQFDNVSATSTRPVYVVQIQHGSAVEYLSTSGTVYLDGVPYTAGGIALESIQDSRKASLSLLATPERIAECISGTWRGEKVCKVYGIPATPDGSVNYVMADAILLLDGIIDDSKLSGLKIAINALHKYSATRYTPRLNCSELSNYIPPAGSVFTWQGGRYVLVSKV